MDARIWDSVPHLHVHRNSINATSFTHSAYGEPLFSCPDLICACPQAQGTPRNKVPPCSRSDDDSLTLWYLRRCLFQPPTLPSSPSFPDSTTLVQLPLYFFPVLPARAVKLTSSLRPPQLLIRLKMRLGTFLSCENDMSS